MSHTLSIRVGVVSIALSMAFVSVSAQSSKRMADGKQWTTENLNVESVASSCYDDADANCRRYGRLYTWESAQRACQALGDGWRLPTDAEWRELATRYGGIGDGSEGSGKAAYTALLSGGASGFNAVLGGDRNADDGKYARQERHGFYWTASERDAVSAVLYNFGRGAPALYRQAETQKKMAASVRCIKD